NRRLRVQVSSPARTVPWLLGASVLHGVFPIELVWTTLARPPPWPGVQFPTPVTGPSVDRSFPASTSGPARARTPVRGTPRCPVRVRSGRRFPPPHTSPGDDHG